MTKKILVETTGSFMLSDPQMKQEIPANRPAVATYSNFVGQRAGINQITILATDLPEDANDADFLSYWKEDKETAVDAYLSKFSEAGSQNTGDPAPDKQPSQRKTTGKRRGRPPKAKAKAPEEGGSEE